MRRRAYFRHHFQGHWSRWYFFILERGPLFLSGGIIIFAFLDLGKNISFSDSLLGNNIPNTSTAWKRRSLWKSKWIRWNVLPLASAWKSARKFSVSRKEAKKRPSFWTQFQPHSTTNAEGLPGNVPTMPLLSPNNRIGLGMTKETILYDLTEHSKIHCFRCNHQGPEFRVRPDRLANAFGAIVPLAP